MAKTKDKRFRDLNRGIDKGAFAKMNLAQRMNFLDTTEGRGLLNMANFTAQELSEEFPYPDRKTKEKLGTIISGKYGVRMPGDKGTDIPSTLKDKATNGGYSRSTSNPAAMKKLTDEQRETLNLIRSGKVSDDDPRVSFLKGLSDDDLKKSGIQRSIGEDGKATYSAGAGPTDEELATELKSRSAGSRGRNLAKNQQEAYTALRQEGMSENAARVAVANLSGEALHKPDDVHNDPSSRNPNQKAHGIVQWDDSRAQRIKDHFGDWPQNMTVAQQAKAMAWEMKTYYPKSWAALNDDRLTDAEKMQMVVGDYERPRDVGGAVNTRLGHLAKLSVTEGGQLAEGQEPTPEQIAKARIELPARQEQYLTSRVGTPIDGISVSRKPQAQPTATTGRNAVISMGSNDYANPSNVYANTLEQIKKARAAGLQPVVISPNPNGKTGAAAAEVARAAQDAGAKLEVPQNYARDGVHPTSEEYSRLGTMYKGSTFSGDSIAVGIGQRAGMQTEAGVDEQGRPTVYLRDENGQRVARQGAGTSEIVRSYGRFPEPVQRVEDIPSMPDGGELQTNADSLQVYNLDKNKLQRDNMIAVDGDGKPQFTMNSKEEMKFNPNTGSVEVDNGARGFKNNPDQLGPEPAQPMENQKTGTQEKLEQQSQQVSNNFRPLPPPVTSTESGPNSRDVSVALTENVFTTPSIERAVARARFQNTSDALGGHFDYGATNMV